MVGVAFPTLVGSLWYEEIAEELSGGVQDLVLQDSAGLDVVVELSLNRLYLRL